MHANTKCGHGIGVVRYKAPCSGAGNCVFSKTTFGGRTAFVPLHVPWYESTLQWSIYTLAILVDDTLKSSPQIEVDGYLRNCKFAPCHFPNGDSAICARVCKGTPCNCSVKLPPIWVVHLFKEICAFIHIRSVDICVAQQSIALISIALNPSIIEVSANSFCAWLLQDSTFRVAAAHASVLHTMQVSHPPEPQCAAEYGYGCWVGKTQGGVLRRWPLRMHTCQ